MQRGQSFTVTAQGRLLVIATPVDVGAAFDPSVATPALKRYGAIWDTGATASVITEKVVTECGLKPIGITKAHGADGEYLTEVYLVCIGLPNGVGFSSLRVTKGKMAGCDLLVGMDVISQGDFALTNQGGKTCFSFRYPSAERVDFTGKIPKISVPKVGRNDPCPCGSGKKFKKCHGT